MNLTSNQLRRAAEIKEKIQMLERELFWVFNFSTKPAAQAKPKLRRKISVSARAKMAAAAKSRWAKVKAAGKNKL
jgi:hypothetical protein